MHKTNATSRRGYLNDVYAPLFSPTHLLTHYLVFWANVYSHDLDCTRVFFLYEVSRYVVVIHFQAFQARGMVNARETNSKQEAVIKTGCTDKRWIGRTGHPYLRSVPTILTMTSYHHVLF